MLDGKVVAVTGAGRGIGRGEALLVAREGAKVVCADIDEAAARLQREHYPAVTGRRYEHSPRIVHEAVRAVIDRRGWRVMRWPDLRQEQRVVTIELEARTRLFGFASDVAIRISDNTDSTYVDMRSASRYGAHDFGDNARRRRNGDGGRRGVPTP